MKKLPTLFIVVMFIVSIMQPITALAQSSITITQNEIVSDFPRKLTFKLSASSVAEIQTVKLLYRTNGASCQPAVAQQEVDITPGRNVEAEWDWDFTMTGILPPGAEVYWQWKITDAGGNNLLSDEQTYQVNDTRRNWKTLNDGQVNLQWYEGNQSFGQSLMELATQSLTRLADNAGVEPGGLIWITIYPNVTELRAVDIHASEWAGGISYTEYNSTIMAIGPFELEWAASVIPHELAHLVTESVVFNCLGMWLPTWLGEGLAVYSEGDIPPAYTESVTNALERGDLPPLRTLERGFSSEAGEADRSYAHSGIMVTYLIDQYGAEKMAELLATIKSGQLIDKALFIVYGKNTDGLEADWRISLGYDPQPTQAPTSASRTSVPTMALWTSVVRPTFTLTSEPTITDTPVPPTAIPTALPSPTLSIPVDDVVGEATGNAAGISTGLLIGIIVGVILMIAILIIVIITVGKRRRSAL